MKYYLLIMIALCFSILASADEDCTTTSEATTVEEQMEIKTDVPNHLKGATIIVRTADGRESSVPAEKFKVVPRKQQFIVTKTKQRDSMMCSNIHKNRASFLVGDGPTGKLDRTNSPSQVTVESNSGPVGGIQYQRSLGKRFNIGGQYQNNGTKLFSIGLDF